MDYTLENEYLKVTVTTFGAQVKSVIRKCDGVEHMAGRQGGLGLPCAGFVPSLR